MAKQRHIERKTCQMKSCRRKTSTKSKYVANDVQKWIVKIKKEFENGTNAQINTEKGAGGKSIKSLS